MKKILLAVAIGLPVLAIGTFTALMLRPEIERWLEDVDAELELKDRFSNTVVDLRSAAKWVTSR
jgi:hypothetical protein